MSEHNEQSVEQVLEELRTDEGLELVAGIAFLGAKATSQQFAVAEEILSTRLLTTPQRRQFEVARLQQREGIPGLLKALSEARLSRAAEPLRIALFNSNPTDAGVMGLARRDLFSSNLFALYLAIPFVATEMTADDIGEVEFDRIVHLALRAFDDQTRVIAVNALRELLRPQDRGLNAWNAPLSEERTSRHGGAFADPRTRSWPTICEASWVSSDDTTDGRSTLACALASRSTLATFLLGR